MFSPTPCPVPSRPVLSRQVEDFQFFPKRLFDLLDMEVYAYRKSVGYQVPRIEPPTEETERERAEEQVCFFTFF